ncbi:MAG: cobaltochelatase subunit CobN [Thermodesulfobacteriota bacterium]
MKPRNLVVYTAASTGLTSLGRACRQMQEQSPGRLQVQARGGDDLFDRRQVERFLDLVRQTDYLLILLHGGRTSCPFFDELMEAVQGREFFIHPSGEDEIELAQELCPDFGQERFNQTALYLKHGGEHNWLHLLRREAGLEHEPPRPQPCQALYHPRLGAVETLEEYLAGLGVGLEAVLAPREPVLGLWFGQYLYQDGNLAHIDAMVRAMEAAGCLPICCFYRRYPDPMLEVRDTRWVFDHYFRHQGRRLIQALISPMTFSLNLNLPAEAGVLEELDVPVLQAINTSNNRQQWEETVQAVTPMDVGFAVAAPEFDGNLISVAMATREQTRRDPITGAMLTHMEAIPERVDKIARLARNWGRLALKPNAEKKVAIVFHNYPPRNDRIGCAAGLDSFASISDLLARLRAEGYQVDETYPDPQDLANAMIGGLTCDQRWLTPDKLAQRAADQAGPERTQAWTAALPATNQAHMAADWGPSPGELFVHEDRVLINGLVNGNVYVGVQPPRGFIEQPEKIHDPHLAPSHHYLFYYRWIRDVFQADAVIHVGKHGSLEWLPGKSVGLSRECYPDLAIMELPNIYPYIVNDPGEGTQAKRRSFCCLVDHLVPVMTNSDTYEEMAQVDERVLAYLQTKDMNPTRLPTAQTALWDMVEKANLHRDLEIERAEALADFDAFLEKLHAYLSEVADTAIADGLHIMGRPPQGEGLVELATQLVRIKNGEVPSLRESLAQVWGYDYDQMLARRGQADPSGRHPTYAVALKALHDRCRELTAAAVAGEEVLIGVESDSPAAQALTFLAQVALPRLAQTGEELEAVVHALSGGYVPPGASGCPTRGRVDVLPTGRNFCSVDPYKLPSPVAWRVGVSLGDDLVERHLKETGQPPDNIGMVIWGSPNMRTQGECIAEALYLMGLKPVWNAKNGRVEGLAVTPLEELKFPRVDVTFRTSGFFRDAFPNLMELLDGAVNMVGSLKEPPESNFLRRNVLREAGELEKQGLTPEEAWREASFRVYSDPPGAYGAGVAAAIDAKAWQTSDDLGEVYVTWGGYAYGKKAYGLDRRENFRRRLKDISLVVKNEDSREYDLLSSDDFNAYFGGFVAAVKMASGIQPRAYSGDASDPDRVRNRSIQEEAKHIFRSRILNPKWIQGLMRHGYKGAGDLSRTVDNSFHWDATSGVIEDWMYDGLAEKYAFDEDMQQWLKQVNPYALQNITERLLEAISRGMWDAAPETKERLEQLFLDIEGDLEDVNL